MPSRKLKKDALICLIVDVFKNLPPSTFEIPNDMNNFGDERKYAAWAGVAAGNNESAGKKKDRSAEKEILTYEES